MHHGTIVVFLAAILFAVAAFVLAPGNGVDDCVTGREERVVRGASLAGIVEGGESVSILYGYYECNPVGRGDIVAFRSGASADPVIKIAAGLPGDTFGLEPSDSPDWLYLVVNGGWALNFAGEPYLAHRTNRRFQLYIDDYGDGIPADTYLLLGTSPHGSGDSTEFGLVHKSDILGKAVRR